jgi:CubicO group peptidase (beta-lactamase class C family)
MRHALLLLVALFACADLARAADADPPKDLEELEQRIETIRKASGIPAIGVALVGEDGPYWVAGWGKADLKSGRAADSDTLFRIGSISKMFAALSVLKLAEEGKLSLDDKVRDRVPDVQFENRWEDTHPVRIAHLLEHTTGWDDIHFAEYAYSAADTVSIKEGLEVHPHSRTSRWPPGTRHAYCNSGSAVAAYIVETVTGRRFEDYVAETFFAPLGMASTSYFKTALYDERGATLYQGVSAQPYWGILLRPAGSINSSARDMARFVHFLLRRGSVADAPLVSSASIDRMETPATTLGAAAGITGGYGLANYSSGYRASQVAFHGHNGGVMGGLSELVYSKELGQGYVFMINSGNGAAFGQISELLRGYLLRDHVPPTPAASVLPASFKELDGHYQAVNHRQHALRFLLAPFAVMKITHDEQFLHRSPLFGAWVSSDRASTESVLIDAWHGLPAIARVEDPLDGPAIQVGSDLFVRIPTWVVFARFIVFGLLVVMTLAGFVMFLVWCSRRFRKRPKTDDHRLWLRITPLIASAALFAFLILLVLSGAFIDQLGAITPLSAVIFLLSLAYPILALWALIQLYVAREPRNFPYWYAVAFAILHQLVAGYLVTNGAFAFKTWS